MSRPHESPDARRTKPFCNTQRTGEVPIRISPPALAELEHLFPGKDIRHVRVIATPG